MSMTTLTTETAAATTAVARHRTSLWDDSPVVGWDERCSTMLMSHSLEITKDNFVLRYSGF
jgi:hypothetical protein